MSESQLAYVQADAHSVIINDITTNHTLTANALKWGAAFLAYLASTRGCY